MAGTGCCKFYWPPPASRLWSSVRSCVVLQALGFPCALCGCCELVRRKVVGFKK